MACHICLCYYFVYVKELGIAGTGYAGSLSNSIIFLSLLIYSYNIADIRKAVQLPDSRLFRLGGILEYLKLGVPAVIMLCLEWWAFEVMTILVGYIGVNE